MPERIYARALLCALLSLGLLSGCEYQQAPQQGTPLASIIEKPSTRDGNEEKPPEKLRQQEGVALKSVPALAGSAGSGAPAIKNGRQPTAVPLVSTVEDRIKQIDAFLGSLKTAAYTFNPPSPIKVAKPVTIHFWLDPVASVEELTEEFRKSLPEDALRVEAGKVKWAPDMEATLKGDNFTIQAVTPEKQPVSAKERTFWSWSITPKQPGAKQPLYLTLNVVPPPELGGPRTIKVLEKKIDVEVTWWWLFDTFFDKYWKWLLGGIGTAFAGLLAWWWKNRKAAK